MAGRAPLRVTVCHIRIGTALVARSVQWARDHGYAAVLAPGAPDHMWQFALWTGHLPWTTYAKLGFESTPEPEERNVLPRWARGNSPPQVMREVKASLDADRPVQHFYDRLMVLRLDAK